MLTLLHLLSAVALLVWGTHIVRTGVMRVYGARLRTVLSSSVEKKPLAFCAGLGVTALVQSSNATTMLVTSFVAQDLVGLTPALVMVLGADVGTALMARVLTFDLSWLSPLLIFIGVIFFPWPQANPRRAAGASGDWSGADPAGPGADCAGREPHHPGQRRAGDFRLADRRYHAGCLNWRRIRDHQLLQPGGGAADGDADRGGSNLPSRWRCAW